jgi:hypothetical protein
MRRESQRKLYDFKLREKKIKVCCAFILGFMNAITGN